ncbi:hypothetical protein L208DRAFT_1381392 [Tricholoma matsutake]|nr:hypothetical protein L208DRAFT_1381392 [Tricholoma matsutake 945]
MENRQLSLEYNRKLKYPTDLPVVNLGNSKKAVWAASRKTQRRGNCQMIQYACNLPRVNAEAILNKGFPTLGLNSATSPIGGFGISINPEMAIIPVRELPPLRLTYKEGKANVNNRSWYIMDVKLHRGAVMASWWIIVVQDGLRNIEGPQDPKLRALVEDFTTKCRKSGMTMPMDSPDCSQLRYPLRKLTPLELTISKTFERPLSKHCRPQGRIGDVELGIQTYFSNVALKANTKLGGVNHLASLLSIFVQIKWSYVDFQLDEQATRWLMKMKTMMGATCLIAIDSGDILPGEVSGEVVM